MHPRISVNGVCFPKQSLAEDIAAWKTLGAHTVGEHVRKLHDAGWDAGVALLGGSGLKVESLVHPVEVALGEPAAWEKFRTEFRRTIVAAKALGVSSIYSTSGHRGSLTGFKTTQLSIVFF